LAVAVAFAGIASFVWLTALSRREQQYTTMKMQKMLALVVR
jgi:hypothetical protein